MTTSISGCLKPNIYLNLHTMEDHLPLGVFWDIENCDVPSGKTLSSNVKYKFYPNDF